ncbi:WbqC family protein [Microtetraspora fusca]|uniref:WbqC family protein n=1 Tax=Microtetraspora fusca TaxID=1997 RepID=UPI001C3F3528|nr:WbqC family protein [Microtetraspora fusca]
MLSPDTDHAEQYESAKRMKRVAIVQSNYIPWKGYIDLIAHVDEFILLDDVQYTNRDWRNRNRIKTATGPIWLSIPIRHGSRSQLINEATATDQSWCVKHWRALTHAYRRAPYFDEYATIMEKMYRECPGDRLSDINRHFLEGLCSILGVQANLRQSTDYDAMGSKTERLIDLCRKSGATGYVTGPAARAYLDETLFKNAGIEVQWFDYSGYPEYPQLHPPFDHHVSVVDLIFSTGPDARRYLKSAAAGPGEASSLQPALPHAPA